MGGALSGLLGGRKGNGRGLTRAQALSTALASTIAHRLHRRVATAIFFGGPGAVFWMWASAFLGMMTGLCGKGPGGALAGEGPRRGLAGRAHVLHRRGLGSPFLAAWFSLACAASSLAGGNLVQSNSIAASPGGRLRLGPSGGRGGHRRPHRGGDPGGRGPHREGEPGPGARHGPALSGGAGCWCSSATGRPIPGALERIITCALSPRAALGGGTGYGLAAALRYGVARGVFTNEAGMGTSAIAHAASETEDPVQEGLMGMFEVFFATLAVCTVTALVILTSGVYGEQAALAAIRSGAVEDAMLGAPLSAAAFSTVLGPLGGPLRGGMPAAFRLHLPAGVQLLRGAVPGLAGRLRPLAGALPAGLPGHGGVERRRDVQVVWQLTDLFNGLMALPNLCALLALSPQVLPLVGRGIQEGPSAGLPGRRAGQRPGGRMISAPAGVAPHERRFRFSL